MTDENAAVPVEIDATRHYPETRKRTIPGLWHPYCPRCCVPWPCPTAIAGNNTDDGLGGDAA